MNNEQQTQADDPSGPGWRDVEVGEILQSGDMLSDGTRFVHTDAAGSRCTWQGVYRRRIEPQQTSDSEPETMDSWEMRLAKMTQWNSELEALVDEAERSGQQVNAELQQLREQVQTLTRELKDKSDSYQICLQSHYKAGQRSTIDRLQAWLRPVIELVAEDPEDASLLAVAVLGSLPHIASRLIEE